MSDIGRVDLTVEFNVDRARNQLRSELAKSKKDLEQALKEGFESLELPEAFDLKTFEDAKKVANQLSEERKKAIDKELDEFEKSETTKRKEIEQTFAAEEKARQKESIATTKAAQREIEEFRKAEDAKRRSVERTTAKIIEEFQKRAVAEQTLFRGHAKVQRELEQQARTKLRSAGIVPPEGPIINPERVGIVRRFTNTLDQADKSLKRFGLTSRDVAIILGAGLAGGIAFAVRSFLEFLNASIQLTAELEKAQNLSRRFFGEFSGEAEEFAKSAVDAFGFARKETLEFANSFGQVLTAIGLTQGDSERLAETLLTLQAAFVRSRPGTTIQEAHTALTGIFRSEFDALEKFIGGLKLEDIQQEAVRLGIAKTTDQVTKQDEAIAGISLVMQRSAPILEELKGSQGDLASETERFNAQIQEAQIALGQILLPTLIEFLKNVNLILEPLTKLSQLVDSLGDKAEQTGDRMDGVRAKIARSFRGFIFGGIVGGIRSFIDNNDAAAEAVDNLVDKNDLLQFSLNATTGVIEVTSDELNRLKDAHERLAETIEDNERRVDRAERNLARTEEDTNRRIAEAVRERRRAYEDAALAIEDAHRRLEEIQKDTSRRIRNAQEELTDAIRNDKRARRNETEDLRKELQRRADAILDAQLSIGQALRRGDADAERQARLELQRAQRNDEIKRKQRDTEEAQFDRELDIHRKRRDLEEERLDAAEEIADAKRDLARAEVEANRRIEDAERRVTEAIRERKEAIADAREALEDARREQLEAVEDALEALKRLEEELGITYAQAIGQAADKQKELNEDLRTTLDLLEKLKNSHGGLPVEGTEGRPIQILQHGGRFHPGLAVVGEDGPELVNFSGFGSVTNNKEFMRILREVIASSAAQGNSFVINQATDPEAVAFAVSSRLVRGLG